MTTSVLENFSANFAEFLTCSKASIGTIEGKIQMSLCVCLYSCNVATYAFSDLLHISPFKPP